MSGLAHLQGQLLMEEQAVNLWPVQYVRRRGGVIRGLVHSFENLDLLSLIVVSQTPTVWFIFLAIVL